MSDQPPPLPTSSARNRSMSVREPSNSNLRREVLLSHSSSPTHHGSVSSTSLAQRLDLASLASSSASTTSPTAGSNPQSRNFQMSSSPVSNSPRSGSGSRNPSPYASPRLSGSGAGILNESPRTRSRSRTVAGGQGAISGARERDSSPLSIRTDSTGSALNTSSSVLGSGGASAGSAAGSAGTLLVSSRRRRVKKRKTEEEVETPTAADTNANNNDNDNDSDVADGAGMLGGSRDRLASGSRQSLPLLGGERKSRRLQMESVVEEDSGDESEDLWDETQPLKPVVISENSSPKRKGSLTKKKKKSGDANPSVALPRDQKGKGKMKSGKDEEWGEVDDEEENENDRSDDLLAPGSSEIIIERPVVEPPRALSAEPLLVRGPPPKESMLSDIKSRVEDGLYDAVDPTMGERIQRPLFWYDSLDPDAQSPLDAYPTHSVVHPIGSSSSALGNASVNASAVSAVSVAGIDSSATMGFGSGNVAEEYTMLVDIKEIQFHNHPLFGFQKRCGLQIEKLFAEFHARQQSRMADYHKEAISALRKAYVEARDNIQAPGSAHVSTEERLARMHQLRADLVRSRTERDIEIGKDSSLVRKILMLWKELKGAQKVDGFIGSTVRCKFKRIPVSDDEIQSEKLDLEHQVEEAIDEAFFRKAAAASQGSGDDDAVSKPDRKTLRQQFASEKFRLRVRNPTDDHIFPIMYSVPVSPIEECTAEERNRRNELSRSKFFVSLIVNNRAAGRSRELRINDRGFLEVAEIFTVKVQSFPQSIAVKVDGTNFDSPPVFIGVPFDGTISFSQGTVKVKSFWEDETRAPSARGNELMPLARDLVDVDPNDPRYAWALKAGKLKVSHAGRSSEPAEPEFSVAPPMSLLPPGAEDPFEILATKQQKADNDREREIVDSEFVRNVRGNAIAQKSEASSFARVQELIQELQFPTWRSVTSFFSRVFATRRRLRPSRRRREVATIRPSCCTLLVQIGRGAAFPKRRFQVDSGFEGVNMGAASAVAQASHATPARARQRAGTRFMRNVPSDVDNRVKATVDEPETEEPEEPEDISLLHPFVEVTFQGKRARTSSSQGSRPLFNETVQLPFNPPNDDYSPDVLRLVREEIFINVYDEVTSELVMDERDTNLFYERRERRYLGNLKIPFSTVYANRKVEGTFRLDVPPVNLGYEAEADLEEDPKLSIYVTLEPTLELFEDEDEEPPTVEDARLYGYAMRWTNSLTEKFRGRREICCFANDLKGRSVLVCRYVRPQEPPKDVRDSLIKIVRFVSCIPFLEDAMSFENRADVWLTSQQFLKLRAGDWEEHAVLLCNYFLFMKKKAYVVVGRGIPEGDTCYVLTVEQNVNGDPELTFWNAATGQSFASDDPFIPLRSVGTVFDAENVYANVQSADFPGSMEYDFENAKHWAPLFTDHFPRPEVVESVQQAIMKYEPTPAMFREELETDLSSTLMRCLEKWRSGRGSTKWHRHACKKLSTLLEAFEKDRQGIPFSIQEHYSALSSLFAGYYMQGFPICIPWTDKDSVIEAVFNTDVHSSGSKDVEFAIGVYAATFPNKVAAIWVYLATLTPRR
eukprot:ANDGO_02017.mRNA.1 hypothetical protein NAEGRDRAFT_77673